MLDPSPVNAVSAPNDVSRFLLDNCTGGRSIFTNRALLPPNATPTKLAGFGGNSVDVYDIGSVTVQLTCGANITLDNCYVNPAAPQSLLSTVELERQGWCLSGNNLDSKYLIHTDGRREPIIFTNNYYTIQASLKHDTPQPAKRAADVVMTVNEPKRAKRTTEDDAADAQARRQPIKDAVVDASDLASQVPFATAHRRFAHTSVDLNSALKHGYLTGFRITTPRPRGAQQDHCDPCASGKMTSMKTSKTSGSYQANSFNDLVDDRCDIMIPVLTSTMTCEYCCRHKSVVGCTLMSYWARSLKLLAW